MKKCQTSRTDATMSAKKARSIPGKTFCEFFAGIGLVREALEFSGWECVYANDVDAKKKEMYVGRFGDEAHFHLGDVRETTEVVSRITGSPLLATASFPCIDLSLAGHWRGFEGDHSSTFFGFADALSALGSKRPPLVILENVVGFITSKGGRDFAAATTLLGELGYWMDAFVVDARSFVPQSRPRVFVVGLREDVKPPFVHRRSKEDWIADYWTSLVKDGPRSLRPRKLVDAMLGTTLPTGWAAFDLKSPIEQRASLNDLIDLGDEQEWWDEAAVKKHYDMMSDLHRGQVDSLLADKGFYVGTIYRRKRNGKTRAEVRFDGTAGCLRTPRGGSARQIVIIVSSGRLRMRWMSAREYARLQGADDFPLVKNNIQNLFGFGDAVCVPAVRWVDQNVLTPVYEYLVRQEPEYGRQSLAAKSTQGDAGGERTRHL